MNLNEQINRAKTLMGLKTLNEGVFKQNGKFNEILSKLLGKNQTNVISGINKYGTKYGNNIGNSTVDGINVSTINNKQLSSSDAQTQQLFCTVSVITNQPQPLPTDKTKKSSNITYLVIFTKNTSEYYEYFKSVYLIDGQQTDEISHMRVGENFTCSTSTLEGKTGSCEFSQEVKDMILKSFENSKDFSELESYLNMIK
jgi:hypothetical protein